MTVTPPAWTRVKAIFDAAVVLDASAGAAYLADACGTDDLLRQHVEALLLAHDRADQFLETPAAVLIDRSADELIGRSVGSYRIVERIGAGGMGEVYRAHDTKLDRPVALKLLPPGVATGADRLRRFHAEAHAASSLNHPNILVIHDFGDLDARPFIVSEFVEGETLRQRLDGGIVPIREAVRIVSQVASALAAAHARGIAHRDIKPENVMLRPDGYVKVLDFGLAKLLDASIPDPSTPDQTSPPARTLPGVLIGTPHYMSPEQAEGKAVDQRSDVFSLGVVLYELATGVRPFTGDTHLSVLSSILRDTPAPVTERNPALPPDLAHIIDSCLAKDRHRRYQSASDLRTDLDMLEQWLRSDEPGALSGRARAAGRPAESPPDIDRPEASAVLQLPAAVALPSSRRRGVWMVVTVAALVGGTIWVASVRKPSALTERDAILLADIENKTGDHVFDDTIETALAVGLEQSPYLRIVSDERVRETLTLMGRPADTRIAGEVAREICQREGTKAMLAGTIAALGSHYVISLDATECRTGESLAREQVEADSKEQVLATLGRAAASLRGKFGESLASVQRSDAPLERATTSSLEALKAFSIGKANRVNRGGALNAEAIPFFKRAIELDPDFALAYVNLAELYASGYQLEQELARQYALDAFARRDRATDLERLLITATYYSMVTAELDKAIETCEVWRRRYPNDERPSNILGIYYRSLGRHEDALEAVLDSVRRNPDHVNSNQNLAMTYAAVNRLAEARALLERLMERRQIPRGTFGVYEIAFVQGDTAAMQREADAARARPSDRTLRSSQLGVLTFGGQYRKARELARGASTAAELRTAAGREALVGHRDEAQRLIGQALAMDSTPVAQAEAAVALAMAGDLVQAEALIQAAAAQFPTATVMNRITLPTARAALELQRGSSRSAITELQTVLPYDRALAISAGGPPVPGLTAPYLRGQALLNQRHGRAAAGEFRKLIENRGLLRVNVLFPLAHLGLGRALVVAGDATGAAKAYQEFFALWKDADSDIPILIQARREFAAFESATPP